MEQTHINFIINLLVKKMFVVWFDEVRKFNKYQMRI